MTILSNKTKPPPSQQGTTTNATVNVSASASVQSPVVVNPINSSTNNNSNSNPSNLADQVSNNNLLIQVGESLSAVTNALVDSITNKSAHNNLNSADSLILKESDNNKSKNNASICDNESKTVNIQISDIQNENEAVNIMPLSSSSSNSSLNSSGLLQTETGCIESSLLTNNNINETSTNTNNSKNKKLYNNNNNNSIKIKSNKKRKLSSSNSSSMQFIDLAASSFPRSLANCGSSLIENHQLQIKVPKLVAFNSPACPALLQPIFNDSQHRQHRTLASTNNGFDLITQVSSNNILNSKSDANATNNSVNTSNTEINSDNDDNNDSDSDFDFLNKTDNQISDDDEDSDLNTQFKQNLINQQIRQRQQLYLQQQQQHHQQQQQHHHLKNDNVLKNSTQNTRKKLTKKKGAKMKTSLLGGRANTIGIKENMLKENEFNNPINSEDEYENSRAMTGRGVFTNTNAVQNMVTNAETIEELESKFQRIMKEKKGFIIKPMKEDGACLFRAVADQIYGDEEMHSTIRVHCMDYIAKNADYFKQYMTEDVDRYLSRKRQDTCHGNHIEIIAIAEIYNRPIEVYEYSIDPKNTFQSVFETDNEPIRLSYHDRNHYNSVVDPYKATIGVGLGLPQLTPGLAEKNLMNEAIKKSEEFHLEKAMMDDKMKATDWEATNEEIMELIARESYLQWLKDNEKRNTKHSLNLSNNEPNQLPGIATCSTWDQNSAPSRELKYTSPAPSVSSPTTSPTNRQRAQSAQRRSSTNTPPHSPSQSKLTHLKSSPKSKAEPSTSKSSVKATTAATTSAATQHHGNMLNLSTSNNEYEEVAYQYYDSMNDLPLDLYGLGGNDWIGLDNQNEGDDILARVLAASQQEYLESLKAKRHGNQQA